MLCALYEIEAKMKLSIVTPVYQNEQIEVIIRDVHEKVRAKFQDSEFIIAEDGSTDKTREILKSLQQKYNLTFNFCNERRGYIKAVKELYEQANGDVIFFLDSDGEHDPGDFWKLYRRLQKGYDLVIGYKTKRRPLYRLFLSKVNNFLIGMMFGVWFRDANCGFRIMKRSFAREFIPPSGVLVAAFNAEMLVRAKHAGKAVAEVPVRHAAKASVVFRPAKMPWVALKAFKELYNLRRELIVK